MSKNNKITFSLVILSLNEIDGCKRVIPRINKTLFDELIAIDGGSDDGTIEYLESQGFTVHIKKKNLYNKYDLIVKRKHLTDAYWLGVEKSNCSHIVIPFTPDENMIPELLPNLINKAKEGYDLVCVSRYKGGAVSYDDTLISGFGNRLFTKLVNILFGGKFTDVLGGYKCVKKNLYNKLGIRADTINVAIHTQLAIGVLKNNLNYADIPGDEPKRETGKSATSAIWNGLQELFTIISAFLIKSKFKIK